MLSVFRAAWLEQTALAWELLSDRRTRAPFETICLAAFGSSLHEAVTSFFYLGIGANPSDIGTIQSVMLVVGLVSAPLVGAHMDARGAVGPMIATSLACAVGCLLRGLATTVWHLHASSAILGFGGVELVVATYLSTVLGRPRRSSVLSGLVVQTGALRLMAKAFFPLLAAALALVLPDREVARYRVALSFCWAFCFYGVVRISTSRSDLVVGPLGTYNANEERMSAAGASRKTPPPFRSPPRPFVPFALAASAVSATAAASTVASILWPLTVRDRFGWGAKEYSVLVLLSEIGRIKVTSLVPHWERRWGRVRPALAVASVSIASTLALVGIGAALKAAEGEGDLRRLGIEAASGPSVVSSVALAHAALALAHLVALRCLEVMVRSLATLALAPSWTSRSFGIAASLSAGGGVFGSMAGTRLYSVNPMRPLYLSILLQLALISLLIALSSLSANSGRTIASKTISKSHLSDDKASSIVFTEWEMKGLMGDEELTAAVDLDSNV